MEQNILVGSDLGYGQIKIISSDEKIKFASVVGTPVSNFGRLAAPVTQQELLNTLAITYQGQRYYLGHNALVNTRNGKFSLRQNKAQSQDNIIKFITSLALLTEEDQTYAEFSVVTGLPVLEFKNQRDTLFNMMFNSGSPFKFTMHYGPKDVEKVIKIKNVKIISQGEGAFYDYALDELGDIHEDRADSIVGTIMIVDPGYRTSDIVTMENGRYLEPLSDQINKGVNQLHQEIAKLIMENFNIKKEAKEIDSLVREGKLFHNMKEYDLSEIISEAARPFAEDIVEYLHYISNDQLGSVEKILLTGGGSNILYPHISDLLEGITEVVLMDNAEYCNASGYYKYGLLLENSGQF